MKKILLFCATFIAVSCASSCNKNDIDLRADQITIIQGAVAGAMFNVCYEMPESKAMTAMGIVIDGVSRTESSGDQESMHHSYSALVAFNVQLMDSIPDALYIIGKAGERLMIENFEMATPELAVVEIDGHTLAALDAVPLLVTKENVDGAQENEFLVDLATINGDKQEDIAVWRADELKKNPENFFDKSFLDLVLKKNQVFAKCVISFRETPADEGGDIPIKPLNLAY